MSWAPLEEELWIEQWDESDVKQWYLDHMTDIWYAGTNLKGDFSSLEQLIEAAPEKYHQELYRYLCRLQRSVIYSGFFYDFISVKNNSFFQSFYSHTLHLDENDPENQTLFAMRDLIMGHHSGVLNRIQIWLDDRIKYYQSSGVTLSHDEFVESLLYPLKQGFPGMWTAIGKMLNQPGIERGLSALCHALELYYFVAGTGVQKNQAAVVDAFTAALRLNGKLTSAKEILAHICYEEKQWHNALAYFEQVEDSGNAIDNLFLFFDMAWCYGKTGDYSLEETYYRKSLKLIPDQSLALNNLGYSLYRQGRYSEAKAIFEKCIQKKRDTRYAANNLVRTMLAMGDTAGARRFICESGFLIEDNLTRQAEKTPPLRKEVHNGGASDPSRVPKNQFSSEWLLEEELVQSMEKGVQVFGIPLKVYKSKGKYGRQFIIPNGRLDILAIDDSGSFYVIELKKDSGYDDVYQQIKDYIRWVQDNMAGTEQNVYGIICLRNPSMQLKQQIQNDPQVRLFEYTVSYQEIL